jgi:hypothetical protein
VASAAAGHDGNGKLRYRGSFDVQLTNSDKSASLSDQLRASSGLDALLVKSEGWGWTTDLRVSLGVHYDVLPTVRLGAVMRTPGLTVLKSGGFSQKGLMAGLGLQGNKITRINPRRRAAQGCTSPGATAA